MPEPAQDLEESISSIAQRVIDDNRKSQAKNAKSYMQEFNKENSDVVGESKALTMTERAERKFNDDPEV